MNTYYVDATTIYQLEYNFLRNYPVSVNSLSQFLGLQITGNPVRICNMYDPEEYWQFDFHNHVAKSSNKKSIKWTVSDAEKAMNAFVRKASPNLMHHLGRLDKARMDGMYIHADTLKTVYRVPGCNEEYLRFFENGIAI